MSPSPSPRSRWKTILLLQLVLWPGLFVVAELAVRWTRGYDGEATRVRVAEIVESVKSGEPDPARIQAVGDLEDADLGLYPYTGFGPMRLVRTLEAELERWKTPPPEDEYRVMILGGSVAAGFGKPGSAGVEGLRAALMADPRFEGRTIRFLSDGYGSYKQPQQLLLACYLLSLGIRPHAIVSLDGFNEVALSLQNSDAEVHPSYPSYSQWLHLTSKWGTETDTMLDALVDLRRARDDATAYGESIVESGWYRSSLIGPRMVAKLERKKDAYAESLARYRGLLQRLPRYGPLAGPSFDLNRRQVLRLAVDVWMESTRTLDDLCKRRGIYFLEVIQPTLHDAGSKKVVTESERITGKADMSWIQGASQGYPMLRKGGELLMAEGIAQLDASRVFLDVEDTLYFDACHFNQEGYAILAKAMGEAFLAQLPEGELPR